MPEEKEQNTDSQNPEKQVPPDSELFAGDIQEKPSQRELFAGDEDFYKFLAGSVKSTSQRPVRHKRLSNIQKVLATAIIAICVMLVWARVKSPSEPVEPAASKPVVQSIPGGQQTHVLQPAIGSVPKQALQIAIESVPKQARQPAIESIPKQAPQQALPPQLSLPLMSPVSLKVADTFYTKKDYKMAYAVYGKLHENLSDTPEGRLLKDFLQLKMALCKKQAGDVEYAGRMFKTLLQTHSPVVRIIANYNLALLEIQKKRYFKACTRAYQVIALIDAVDFDTGWALSLQRHCHFLVAECLTRRILSLCDVDKDLPKDLWKKDSDIDPFINLNQQQLLCFLNSGLEQLNKVLLGPHVRKLDYVGYLDRWLVVCDGVSLEELLSRFAANANFDINWGFDAESNFTQVENDAREKTVTLCMSEVTTQQFLSAAAGCVGLLAQLDEKNNVNIIDPSEYSSLSEHISLLNDQAVSLWQRFLLVFHDDKRIPNAHFALGLLQVQKGQLTEAIAEYKLVANSFSRTSIAPFALLHSSKLKTHLRDFMGARDDLKQLVEQYPDAEITSRACLYLADSTAKVRLYGEASRLYSKVYHLGHSLESQMTSALGAARSFYENQDYQSALKWLNRYLAIAKKRSDKNLYSACLLLGKTNMALKRPAQACESLKFALKGELPAREFMEAVSALVEAQIQQQHFVEALEVLQNVRPRQIPREDAIEIVLLKSRIFREIGLIDKAVAAIGNKAEYISEPSLKGKLSLELAKCHIAQGRLELARGELAEILVFVEPGPLAREISLELADICLKLGKDSKVIDFCSQVLGSKPSVEIKRRALNILAAVYKRQKNYDKAAAALLGKWNEGEASHEKTAADSPTITNPAPAAAKEKTG